ncbi:hypothetical protein KAFR_0F01210 [Kazachstania africana CBS 2517]|uniref:C2H2-type domain-containing protein n=1 Tax=Kazachstania africana (strain ATCC 22294 / BCRC 22015 / CBS 2517 / CECT 1963 / NBRC 1671 / NRRL Y-8276) TaxID=1071382 RepID=H2AWG7_KAZAF|nr:hypothetical protein KAFR_0F01210 [Kazachstania africana CBS 2517]CCF58717.1 hypothetical protein KAFR_0F01210 [Kazachstania africana CBS 2517]
MSSTSSGGKKSKRTRKSFTCHGYGDCHMTFARAEHLARHVRRHTGEKPFECNVCFKHFSRVDNLKQHKETVHANVFIDEMSNNTPINIKNKRGKKNALYQDTIYLSRKNQVSPHITQRLQLPPIEQHLQSSFAPLKTLHDRAHHFPAVPTRENNQRNDGPVQTPPMLLLPNRTHDQYPTLDNIPRSQMTPLITLPPLREKQEMGTMHGRARNAQNYPTHNSYHDRQYFLLPINSVPPTQTQYSPFNNPDATNNSGNYTTVPISPRASYGTKNDLDSSTPYVNIAIKSEDAQVDLDKQKENKKRNSIGNLTT